MTRSVLPRLFLWPLETHLDQMTVRLLRTPGSREVDFSKPVGEPALVGVDSVSWRIFKNPVSVFVGGIAAVILELAEPSVRSGVWEHSSFRTNPVRRLQRTGMAAMMTVYGPRNAAEKMIAGVVRRHDTVSGTTPDGEAYHANDRKLLDWVQATAAYGFAEAYNRYVHPLGEEGLSQVFAEGADAARLYGAAGAPVSWGGWKELLKSKRDRLAPSPIVFEFLDIMADAPVAPAATTDNSRGGGDDAPVGPRAGRSLETVRPRDRGRSASETGWQAPRCDRSAVEPGRTGVPQAGASSGLPIRTEGRQFIQSGLARLRFGLPAR